MEAASSRTVRKNKRNVYSTGLHSTLCVVFAMTLQLFQYSGHLFWDRHIHREVRLKWGHCHVLVPVFLIKFICNMWLICQCEIVLMGASCLWNHGDKNSKYNIHIFQTKEKEILFGTTSEDTLREISSSCLFVHWFPDGCESITVLWHRLIFKCFYSPKKMRDVSFVAVLFVLKIHLYSL